MDIKTKRVYEFENKYIELIEEFERMYGVKVVVLDTRRIDKYEAEQSYREIHRTECFKDVKTSLEQQINLRFWYYRELLGIPRKEVINRLCSDFLRGVNTIEKYLMGGEKIRNSVENKIDIDKKIPLFDWSVNKRVADLYPIIEYTKAERKCKREEAIVSYYYFYGSLLGYSDIDREYVICYRDFDITPKQLGLIIDRNRNYLLALENRMITIEELRSLFPMFAWSTAISFNEWDEIPEDCDILINTLHKY